MRILFWLFVIGGLFLTTGVGVNLASLHESDAAGQSLAQGFAFVLHVALWLVLGALVVLGMSGGPSRHPAWLTALLYAAGATGASYALFALLKMQAGDRFTDALKAGAIGLPLLVILECVWGTAISAAAIALLAAVPLALYAPALRASKAAYGALLDDLAAADRRKAALLAELEAMPPDVPLESLLAYVDVPPSKISDRPVRSVPGIIKDIRWSAIQRMMKLPRYQQQAEELLGRPDGRMIPGIDEFHLQPTPGLCAAGRKGARRAIEQLAPSAKAVELDEDRATELMKGISWLQENGCDCAKEFEELERTALLYPKSPSRESFLDYLKRVKYDFRLP
jgi:hypothetical protein